MDEKLKQLIENENEANNKLDYAQDDYSIDFNIDVLNAATEVTSAYVNYKKAEQEYNKIIKERDAYYDLLNNFEIKRSV